MKPMIKIAMLASAMMLAQPVFANDMDANAKPHHTMHHSKSYNSQRMNENAQENLDAADRMNGSDSRMVRGERYDNRWMGMNATTRGMKDGVDSDMNNRSQHAFIFGNSESHVVKH